MPIPSLPNLLAAARAVSDDVVAELHRALIVHEPPPLRPAAIHYTHVGRARRPSGRRAASA